MATSIVHGCIPLMIALGMIANGSINLSASQKPNAEPQIAEKVAARVGEEAFWSMVPVKKTQLRLILFVNARRSSKQGFDVLAVLPEIGETIEICRCGQEPPIILQGWGSIGQPPKDQGRYLVSETSRFSEFVAQAEKQELTIGIVSDPESLFNINSSFRDERTKQIKLALGALVPKRPLEMTVADFSQFTDQINVLVPSTGKMYVMSVVHRTCSNESLQVGREIPLASVSSGLKQKIERYSTSEVIKRNP